MKSATVEAKYDEVADFDVNEDENDIEDEIHHLSPTKLIMKENMAIAMSYFAVGFVSSFIATPLNVYLVNTLNAEPTIQSTIGILQSLPWSLKLIFGFLSDAFPINGMHRKPYLTMGALIYSFAYITFASVHSNNIVFLATCVFVATLGLIELDVMADTMCIERSKFEADSHKGQMQASCYSIRFGGGLVGAILGTLVTNKSIWGWGLSFHQVALINGLMPFLLVTPWLYVLKEKYHKYTEYSLDESTDMVTHLTDVDQHQVCHQSHVHNDNSFSSIELVDVKPQGRDFSQDHQLASVEHVSPSFTYSSSYQQSANKSSKPLQQQVQSLDASYVSHTTHVSVSLVADDDDKNETHPILLQLNEIWETVQLQSVWRPMAFVYLFNLMQVPNVAWQSYLQLSLQFSPWVLGLTVTLGSFMTFAGILAYKYLFFKASWRSIYVWTSLLTGFFSLLQMLLIFQINTRYLHLNNYLFSLGDDVISAYISGIQFLPVCTMYMRLCPDGSEGASYSMLTTFSNIALVCASNLGNHLAGVWDVSNEAMRRHDVSGLWKLSLLTTVLQTLPLSLLWLLPRNAAEQEALARSKVKSQVGGAAFLTVLGCSLLWTIYTAVCRLLNS